MGRDPTRCPCGSRQGEVSGELVQAHREPTPRRSDEVDLHDHGRRPREPLTDTQKPIRDEHPRPRWRPHEEEWYWDGHEPPAYKDLSAPNAIGESSSQVVGNCLRRAKHDDEEQ